MASILLTPHRKHSIHRPVDAHRALWLGACWLIVGLYWYLGGVALLNHSSVDLRSNYAEVARIPHGLIIHGLVCVVLGTALASTLILLLSGRPFCTWRVVALWATELYAAFIAFTIIAAWIVNAHVQVVGGPVAWFVVAALSNLARAFPPLSRPPGAADA